MRPSNEVADKTGEGERERETNTTCGPGGKKGQRSKQIEVDNV